MDDLVNLLHGGFDFSDFFQPRWRTGTGKNRRSSSQDCCVFYKR
jgi:hypothetical protein